MTERQIANQRVKQREKVIQRQIDKHRNRQTEKQIERDKIIKLIGLRKIIQR